MLGCVALKIRAIENLYFKSFEYHVRISNFSKKLSINYIIYTLLLQNIQSSSYSQSARRFSIRRCIDFLVHACQCKEANCRLASCARMKRVITHIKTCKRRTNGNCPICRQLVALCCHHARTCDDSVCPVPFCFNIKIRLRQQHQHQRVQPTA